MNTTFKNRVPAWIVLIAVFVLTGCGGGGGGGGGGAAAPPGDGTAPVAPQADAFLWTGNTPLTVGAVNGLLANDPIGVVVAAPGVRATTLGGTVNIAANGSFTYDPPAGAQNVSDTFTYTVAGFAPVTATISLVERVWFVDNTALAGGDGSFAGPFTTLAEAEVASDADDTIFVFAGNTAVPIDLGPDRVITLKSGQRLIGKGVGLRVNGIPIVDPVPNAVITNGGPAVNPNTPVVLLSTGNEVAGFTINAVFNEGILTTGGAGHNLHDNTINLTPGTGREGIRLLAFSGENSVTFNTINGSPRDAIKLANNEDVNGDPAAAFPVVATVTLSRNTISDSGRDGIAVTLDGAGADVELNILTNRITNSGTDGANEGINIDSLGAAIVTAVVSRNTISRSTDEAIDLGAGNLAGDTSSIFAFVANSDLSLSGAAADFLAATAAGSESNFCLELENNVSTAGVLSTFRVENNSTGVFQFFEGLDNDTAAIRGAGIFTPALPGDCGVPLPGAALFVANCTICHTGNGLGLETRKVLIAPDVTNRSADEINLQLAINGSMVNINLTGREVDAIAVGLAAQ